MTPDRLRELLDMLRWSQRDLAAVLDCDDRLVRRWTCGAPGYAIPDSVAGWLEQLAAAHLRFPPPVNWRTRQIPEAMKGPSFAA